MFCFFVNFFFHQRRLLGTQNLTDDLSISSEQNANINEKAHAVTWKMTLVQHLSFLFLGILLAQAEASVCEDLKLAQPLFSNISQLPSQDSASVMLRNLVSGSCKVQEYTEEAESLLNEFKISEANINVLAGARANAQLPKPDTRSPCSSDIEVRNATLEAHTDQCSWCKPTSAECALQKADELFNLLSAFDVESDLLFSIDLKKR